MTSRHKINTTGRARWYLVLTTCCAFCSAPKLLLAQSVTDVWDRPTLTGDWDGLRTQLERLGITFYANYTSESAGNLSGGVAQAARYAQQLELETLLDLQHLVAVPDARIEITMTNQLGRSLSNDAMHNQFQVQELYTAGQNTRLAELNYQQDFAGHGVTVQLGWSPVGDHFATLPDFCKFQNGITCGHASAMTVNSGADNFPVGEWGASVKLLPDAGFYAAAGVYLDNQNVGNADGGFNLGFQHTGEFFPVELGWNTGLGENQLPGHYIVGAYYNRTDTPDVLADINGGSAGLTSEPFLTHPGRDGGYLIASQTVYRDAGNSARRVSAGAMIAVGDRSTSTFSSFWSVGGVIQGTFSGRTGDFISVMFARANTNPRLSQYQQDRDFIAPGTIEVQTWEAAAEIDYGALITPWLTLRPNVQYILRPGGAGIIPDALVIGLYAQVLF